MDWFERLTGFRETSYDNTRARLSVDGDCLHSLVNGKRYAIGSLQLVSLSDLRERANSISTPSGHLKVQTVTGDVRQMHRDPGEAHAGLRTVTIGGDCLSVQAQGRRTTR